MEDLGDVQRSQKEKKLPREAAIFMASINDNGTISITAPRGYVAGYYAPYYDMLAKATQQHINPENNTYEAFCYT